MSTTKVDARVTSTHHDGVRPRHWIIIALLLIAAGFWTSSWRGVLWVAFFVLLVSLAGGLVWAIRHPAKK